MKKDDLHLRFLYYGAQNSNGFTLNEAKNDLSLSEPEFSAITNETRGADIIVHMNQYRPDTSAHHNDMVVILSFESMFKLLEFEELEQARKSSTLALVVAIIAIVISIWVGIFQILRVQDVRIINANDLITSEPPAVPVSNRDGK